VSNSLELLRLPSEQICKSRARGVCELCRPKAGFPCRRKAKTVVRQGATPWIRKDLRSHHIRMSHKHAPRKLLPLTHFGPVVTYRRGAEDSVLHVASETWYEEGASHTDACRHVDAALEVYIRGMMTFRISSTARVLIREHLPTSGGRTSAI
jgi:hypothetical protein